MNLKQKISFLNQKAGELRYLFKEEPTECYLMDEAIELEEIAEYLQLVLDNQPPKPKMEKCPDCGKQTVKAQPTGGVACTNPDCNYWFCY